MLSVTEFQIDHLGQVEEHKELLKAYKDNPEMIKLYTSGPAYTMYDELGIVAMGGLMIQGTGVGLAWTIPTKRVAEYPIYYTKIGKWVVRTGLNLFELHKIYCFIETDDPIAIRWAQALGFEREALLKKHNWDGKDVYVYSVFKE
jgi:hypothetical protein